MMTDFLEELMPALSKIQVLIEKYRQNKNIVHYVYLGIKNEDIFEYGFNCEVFFSKVSDIINSTKEWDKVDNNIYTLYSTATPTVFVEDNKTDNKLYKRVILHEYTFSYKNTPFDFQYLVFEYSEISQEAMINLTEELDELGKYTIDNFYLRDSCVGLYQCEAVRDTCIEVEQGLLVKIHGINDNVNNSMYVAHDFLLRLRDIINLCEEIKNGKIDCISEYNNNIN
jgi:hypothetical protein